jgi:hypothetical protein
MRGFYFAEVVGTSVCTRDNDVSHLDKTVVCFHNVMEFHNCHKFTAKARVIGCYIACSRQQSLASCP